MSRQGTTFDNANDGSSLIFQDKENVNSSSSYKKIIAQSNVDTNASLSYTDDNIKYNNNINYRVGDAQSHKRSKSNPVYSKFENKRIHLEKEKIFDDPKTRDNSYSIKNHNTFGKSHQKQQPSPGLLNSDKDTDSEFYLEKINERNNLKEENLTYSNTVEGKQMERVLSPSKDLINQNNNQYNSETDEKLPYNNSDCYSPSKNSSRTQSNQNYSESINKNKYLNQLSINSSHPSLSSPSYEVSHFSSTFKDILFSEQKMNGQSKIRFSQPERKNTNSSTSSSDNNNIHDSNNANSELLMRKPMNSLLLKSESTNLNNSTGQNNDDSRDSINCLPTPCSSVNSTPTNKQCNDEDRLEDINCKEIILKTVTLSDNTCHDGKESSNSSNINENIGNSSSTNVPNINYQKDRTMDKQSSIPLITPESSTVSGTKEKSLDSSNIASSSNSNQFNLQSSRHQPLYSNEISEPTNSSLTLQNSFSNLSRYPINNNKNPNVSQSEDFRTSYINTSSALSFNMPTTDNDTHFSDTTLNSKYDLLLVIINIIIIITIIIIIE